MALNVGDLIDLEDMDVEEGGGILLLLEWSLMDEQGGYSEEAKQALIEYKKQSEEYNKKLEELYSKSYKEVSLWMYQCDTRKMFTEEDLLIKIRKLKLETIDKRKELNETCFSKEYRHTDEG